MLLLLLPLRWMQSMRNTKMGQVLCTVVDKYRIVA
jgi:hypothetical protein